MSFGRAKRRLQAVINRKDLTPELAGDFILDAIAALERDLRIGPMEATFEKSTWNGQDMVYPVPTNYLETIRFFTSEGVLDEVDLDTFLNAKPTGTTPKIYTRIADRFLVKPAPAPDTVVYLHYYGESRRPKVDEDSSFWTEACFQATVYKAAELAAVFYQMEPQEVAAYAQQAMQAAESIAGQALSEVWSGRLTIGAPKGVGEY